MKITINNPEGKAAGWIDTKDNKYVTRRTPETYMVKYQGFGISDYILEELKKNNVHTVYIIYVGKEKDVVYYCEIGKFLQSNKTWDDNGDTQKFVSISDMYELK